MSQKIYKPPYPRTRVFTNTSSPKPGWRSVRTYPNGTWTSTGNLDFSYGSSDVMNDVVTPGFKELVAEGKLINTPMLHTKVYSDTSDGFWEATPVSGSGYQYKIEGNVTDYRLAENHIGLTWPDYHSMWLEAKQIAKQTALNNVDSTPYEFMEDVGEIRSTLELLTATAQNALGLVLHYRASVKQIEGLLLDPDKRAKLLADAWLVFMYGFMPLYDSSKKIIEAVKYGPWRYPKRRTARGFKSATSSYQETQRQYYGTDIYDGFAKTQNVLVNCRAGIVYENNNPQVGWQAFLGLRLKDLPKNLWALTGMSFVVDWFLNISAMINALVNLSVPELQFLTGWCTSELILDRRYNWSEYKYSPYTASLNGNVCRTLTSSKQREIWIPSAADALPVFQLPGSLSQFTTIWALIIQKLMN